MLKLLSFYNVHDSNASILNNVLHLQWDVWSK